jgi:S-DNA-T family DNA segregation ATPase FtsK/SpoIIIE
MSAAYAIGQRAWVSARMIWDAPIAVKFRGMVQALLAVLLIIALMSWNAADPSLNAASGAAPTNWLGDNGAVFADLFMQSLGLAAWPAALLMTAFGLAAAIGDASICMYAAAFAPALPPDNKPAAECGR